MSPVRALSKVPLAIGLIIYLVWEMILSTLQVAHNVVMPNPHMKPGVVAVPLDIKSNVEILILANCITLTPGSLTLDVSEDRKTLYAHAMFIESPEKFRQAVKSGFERRILELFR